MIADEVVERAAYALEKKIKQSSYGWSDEQFEIWWNDDPYFVKRETSWGDDFGRGTPKNYLLWQARIILEAALSLGKPVAYTTQAQLDKAKESPGHNTIMWGEPLPYHPDIPLYLHPAPEPDSVWQPMETAPKDGRHSIFAVKFGPFVYSIQGTWDSLAKKWINAADRHGEYLAWMPNIMLPDEFCPWTDEYKTRMAEPPMTDPRPKACRFRLKDGGLPYPKSSCVECGRTVMTGLGNSCHLTEKTDG